MLCLLLLGKPTIRWTPSAGATKAAAWTRAPRTARTGTTRAATGPVVARAARPIIAAARSTRAVTTATTGVVWAVIATAGVVWAVTAAARSAGSVTARSGRLI